MLLICTGHPGTWTLLEDSVLSRIIIKENCWLLFEIFQVLVKYLGLSQSFNDISKWRIKFIFLFSAFVSPILVYEMVKGRGPAKAAIREQKIEKK